jgi:pyridoxal phosphate enzyme (YggS family)
MPIIPKNISQINQNIQKTITHNTFNEQVSIVAVSKGHSFDKIVSAFDAGIRNFGENYLQEALEKKSHLEKFAIQWHFLGPIQSNKCKLITENFDWVHSVDRVKVMKLLNDFRPLHMTPLNICIQINCSGEETKSGIAINNAIESLNDLISSLKELPMLKLRGIMSIPSNTENIDQIITEFKSMYKLYTELKKQINTVDTLSMGMSNDYTLAIEHGSNLVRIGTAIFGAREIKIKGSDN